VPARLARLCLLVGALSGGSAQAQEAGVRLSPVRGPDTAIPAEQAEAYLAGAQPMQAFLSQAAGEGPVPVPDSGPMQATRAHPGRPVRAMIDEADLRPAAPSRRPAVQELPAPALAGTPYQASVTRLFPGPIYAPYRAVGLLVFTASDGRDYWCHAALIERAILLTAGHCVFQGGNGSDQGFNTTGYFYPGYSAAEVGSRRFGRCRVTLWATTEGWYRHGILNRGEDIGLALCDRVEGARWTYVNNWLPGERLGYLGFCYSGCRQGYQLLTQPFYEPGASGGGEMHLSRHLAIAGQPVPGAAGAVGRDLVFGSLSGPGGGGAPQLAATGLPEDGGQAVVVAVTSWALAGAEGGGIRGASALSGVADGADFAALYNAMCRASRRVHGTASCRPLR